MWALATVCWGGLLAVVVELASLGNQLKGEFLQSAWLLINVGLIALIRWLVCRRRRQKPDPARSVCPALSGIPGGHNANVEKERAGFVVTLRAHSTKMPRDAKWCIAIVGFLASFLLGLAVALPTTNWDSLTYHLPRFLHWLQQGNVLHFATNNSRQIEFGPWSSFAMMHLFVFSGNDRLLNLLQWFAMVSTIVVVCGVARHLAESRSPVFLAADEQPQRLRRIASVTALLLATLPMGVIQAASTQNDYTATCWLSCAVLFGLALIREPSKAAYAVGIGAALGLGTLTKATVFVYAAPLLAAFAGWSLLRWRNAETHLKSWALAAAAFLLLNSAHMLRNDALFGSPLGSPGMFKIERNERMGLLVTWSNFLRNLSLHTNSGVPPVTKALDTTLAKLHRMSGADPNDPATTYHLCTFRFGPGFVVKDSYASATWHTLLLACGIVWVLRRAPYHRTLLVYTLAVLASALLFCAYL